MSTLRDAVFNAVKNDAVLLGYGIDEGSTYPQWTVDTPATQRWVVLRWGVTTVGIGGARPIDLGVWVYDKNPSYDTILAILRRIRQIMELMPLVRTDEGSIIEAVWTGSSDDLHDPNYNAYVRNESYRIVATGI